MVLAEVAVSPGDTSQGTPAIRTIGLRRSFKGDVEAVRGVDLTVAEGEVFGFLGPNGAGKTTTVRMLCTLLAPSAGTATVLGLDVVRDAAAVRERIGVAQQEIGLDPLQTGRELLELQCALFGMSLRRARERAAEMLELVGLTDAADRRTKTYSGGMKRRLDLATALVHSPAVLFLDEPTTGLDPASRLAVWDEVRRINKTGTTIFLTTQYLEEADQLCRRISIIDGGRIVAEGSPAELKAEVGQDVVTIECGATDRGVAEQIVRDVPGLQRVAVEDDRLTLYVHDGAASVAEVMRRFYDKGLVTGGISVARPSLDDVFLAATGRHIEPEEDVAP